MRQRSVILTLCLLAVIGLIVSTGCNAFSPEKMERRRRVVRQDLQLIPDDVDWVLGLDEPSVVHEETFPPYRY